MKFAGSEDLSRASVHTFGVHDLSLVISTQSWHGFSEFGQSDDSSRVFERFVVKDVAFR